MITVRYFAAAKERLKIESETIEFRPQLTVQQLLDDLARRHAGFAALRPLMRVAVNLEFVALSRRLEQSLVLRAAGWCLFMIVFVHKPRIRLESGYCPTKRTIALLNLRSTN